MLNAFHVEELFALSLGWLCFAGAVPVFEDTGIECLGNLGGT